MTNLLLKLLTDPQARNQAAARKLVLSQAAFNPWADKSESSL